MSDLVAGADRDNGERSLFMLVQTRLVLVPGCEVLKLSELEG